MGKQATVEPAIDAALLQLASAVRDTGYSFVTPTPATIARVNARPEARWAKDLRGVFGWSRPFRDGLVPPEILALMVKAGVLASVAGGAQSHIRLSILDGELFLHSAYPTIAADAVFFGPDTYRYARAIKSLQLSGEVTRAVDIGCGAGPGAILLARLHPQADILAVDINPDAIRLTRVNASLAGRRVTALEGDLLEGVHGHFDLIVANPPYLVDPAERAYRHGGGPLGAALSLRILDTALDRLAPGGTLLLYTGAAIIDGVDPLHGAAAALIGATGAKWNYAEVDPDVFGEELEDGVYASADRIAAVALTLTR